MSWSLFGFYSGSLVPIAGGSSSSSSTGGTSGWFFHVVPGTEDFVNFRIPTDYPVVENSLTLEINGLIQSPADYQVQPDGLTFIWLDSANPLSWSDDIRVSFAI